MSLYQNSLYNFTVRTTHSKLQICLGEHFPRAMRSIASHVCMRLSARLMWLAVAQAMRIAQRLPFLLTEHSTSYRIEAGIQGSLHARGTR